MVKCNLRKPLRSARISLIQALSLSLLTFSNSSIATLVKKQTRLARHITNQPGKFQMRDVFKPTTGTSTVARPRKSKFMHCIVSSHIPEIWQTNLGRKNRALQCKLLEPCDTNHRQAWPDRNPQCYRRSQWHSWQYNRGPLPSTASTLSLAPRRFATGPK